MKRMLATTLIAAWFLATGAAATAQTLVINSFGGDYEKRHQELVIEPFEEKYDVNVEVVTLYSADTLARLRAQKDNPQFDVVHFSGGQEEIAAREDLLTPIRPRELSHYDDLYPMAVEGIEQGQGPVYSIASLGLIYNTNRVSPAPTSWSDLQRDQLCGHILFTDIGNTYGLLGLLMMNRVNGGSLDNIQPGLDYVSGLLDCATVVSKSPEIQQHFAQGDAWIAPYAQDYAFTLQKAGLPVNFVLPEEGSPAIFITISVVAGRPNTELAKKFVDFSLRPEAQEGWATALHYSPTNRKATLPPDVAETVVYGQKQIEKLVRFDATKVNENRSRWTDEWNRTIAK